VRIADINPDLNDTIKTTPANSWPTELAVLDGTLYFSANGGGSKPNHELWKSDGSSVVLVANINTNTSGSDLSSYPKYLTELNGALYFMADDGVNGYELWKVTQAGASLFANLNPGSATSHSYPKFFTPLDGFLYFQAVNNTNGYELWKTDGSSAPVRIDLRVGSGSSFPEFFAGFRGELYFRATNGTTGYELWKYNGTTASLASNINPTGDSFPKNLIVFKDNLYFAANDGVNGWELWKYDGVSSSLVANLNPSGDSFPENLVIAHDILYFVATTPATGYEVWKYDGISVTLAADVNPGPNPSNPRNLVAFKNELCFSASIDGVEDWELWRILAAPFRVTSIERTGGDIHLTWNTLGGTTNVVQVSDGGVGGPYVNLSAPMVIPGVSPTTADYSHVGGAAPGSRFYRIVQP
jgi:ELWxxDGT repeat protein